MTPQTFKLNTLAQPHWTEQQHANAETVLTFIQQLMNQHDFDLIIQKQGETAYRQHNRNMPDGIHGVVNALRKLTKRFPEFSYDVKRIFVDGDNVIVHSHATVQKKHRGNDKKGFNIIDTWTVKDGMLIEHWDVVQPLDSFMRLHYWLTGGSILNNNGVF